MKNYSWKPKVYYCPIFNTTRFSLFIWSKKHKDMFFVQKGKRKKFLKINVSSNYNTKLGKTNQRNIPHIEQIQNEFKLNDNAKISYQEFKDIIKRATDLEVKDAQIARSFELFVDDKGFIQLEKFKHALMTLGDDRLTKEDIMTLLRDAGFDEKTEKSIHFSKILELVQGNVL
ncbi:hypothetical protein RFI_12986 [Reticulomyxa filosa]|uniref:Centrin n=1 Tax=Reticulomyxa filosa TaxID=46433 RepID=X6NE57_RETFI|nr:hypothetical protein RFI_12986 [Reticulomyxa filosa]|eukprot:ETO24173.1 hypothetical protein RFI_12986 [Reticulomyxa filosa]